MCGGGGGGGGGMVLVSRCYKHGGMGGRVEGPFT